MIDRSVWMRRVINMYSAIAAAVRNNVGNPIAMAVKPLKFSRSAALDG